MANFKDVRVLVIDDNQNMRKVWQGIFTGFGVGELLEAATVPEAVEALTSNDIHAVIVDQHLGDLLGSDFIQILRRGQDSPAPHVPIIACTADTRRTTIRQLIDAGADEVLAKPVSAEQVWKKLSMLVNRRRDFVKAPKFTGPDRRRLVGAVEGFDRRQSVESPVQQLG